MPKYIIEREFQVPAILETIRFKGISQKSCQVLGDWGPRFSGWKALSPMIKSIVSISPPTRK